MNGEADKTAAARPPIPPSEWKRRRIVVFTIVTLCALLIVATWIYVAIRGGAGAPGSIDRIVDSAFYLLGFVAAVYVGAPVADDAFHKFAIAKTMQGRG